MAASIIVPSASATAISRGIQHVSVLPPNADRKLMKQAKYAWIQRTATERPR